MDHTPGPEPEIRLGDDDAVVVSVQVPASADEAWQAITRRERVALWLGSLTGELEPQASVRLDFGDGDFFDLDVVQVDPSSRRLRWSWRFMGCAPRDDIEIAVNAVGREAQVTVRDSQPQRGREASLELGEGWRDFTSRLQAHLRTGARTRYDWRSDVDVWIELPADAGTARRTLIPAAAAWLPLDGAADLFGADALVLGGPAESLAIEGIEPAGPGSVRFIARPAGQQATTKCLIAIEPRGEEAVLAISQTGFGALDATDRQRRDWRERCARAWLAAARRARELLEDGAGASAEHVPNGGERPWHASDNGSRSGCPLYTTNSERSESAAVRSSQARAVAGCPLRKPASGSS